MTSSTSSQRAPTGDVALTHLSRVRAAVVTVAILFWKSNWTGGTATLPFRQVCCENPEGMKIWITLLGARWDSEYIFWGLALDWLIFRHAACNINRKNGLIATIRMGLCTEKPLSFAPSEKVKFSSRPSFVANSLLFCWKHVLQITARGVFWVRKE